MISFSRAGLKKNNYKAFSRPLMCLSRVKSLDNLVEDIKKTMPKKPRSKPDTWVPIDEDLYKLKEGVKASENPVLITIYNVLVSSGCRLVEAYTLVKTSEDFGRCHLDYVRNSKTSTSSTYPWK